MEDEDEEGEEEKESTEKVEEVKSGDSALISETENNDDKQTSNSAKSEPSVVRMLPTAPGSWPWVMENVVYRALKLKSFVPPQRLSTDGSVLRVANLTDLYKVFERC